MSVEARASLRVDLSPAGDEMLSEIATAFYSTLRVYTVFRGVQAYAGIWFCLLYRVVYTIGTSAVDR